MEIILIAIIILLSIFLIISLHYNYKLSKIIFEIEEAIEYSLDILNERYGSIQEILKIPICYNSPEIRQVMNDIKTSRDSILYIANRLVGIDNNGEEEESKESK